MTNPIVIAALLAMLLAAQPVEPRVARSPKSMNNLSSPAIRFKTILMSAQSQISDALTMASKSLRVKTYGDDSGLLNALEDCVDLLELSALEISWAISSVQNETVVSPCADFQTWLTGVCKNHETCIQGLDGISTGASVKAALGARLSASTSLAEQALDFISPGPTTSAPEPQRLPHWVSADTERLLQDPAPSPNVTVSVDGTGNFTTIMEAVAAVPDNSEARFVIYVKRGVYYETVRIGKKKNNVMMYGDGMDATVVTGNVSANASVSTYHSATFGVLGRGFIARDMTFENTAGPYRHQAVAYRSDSDHSALYRCAFRGYQDTLYLHRNRQFYRECTITGTVDFIFGDATAVFQHSLILVKKGLDNQTNTITAQAKNCTKSPSGFSLQYCNISADVDLLQANSTLTYLGRPWGAYSRTVIMESYISNIVTKEGWLDWDNKNVSDNLYIAEYNNYGPGANVSNRVNWPGFHVLNSSGQAEAFTVQGLICGDSWLPGTGIGYDQGTSGI